MKKLKIAHLASFHGNIGDQLNHMSFRPWLETLVNAECIWSEFEIRDCYRKEKKLNPDFIEFAKQNDLVIIGGGNYFELWPEQSINGTSIDLSFQDIKNIGKPVFFNSLGVDSAQGISSASQQSFRHFFDLLCKDSRCFVTVRNDGSIHQLRDLNIETDNVGLLPDAVFFNESIERTEKGVINIGINLAEDMPHLRFGSKGDDEFLETLGHIIENMSMQREQTRFVFIPHIYSDLAIISRLLKKLPDLILRSKSSVAKYSTSASDLPALIDVYAQCDLVLAMRFHSNVLPLGMGVPTIGLSTYPQIRKLYAEIGLHNQCILPSDNGFEEHLNFLISDALLRKSEWIKRQELMKRELLMKRSAIGSSLATWLSTNVQL
jgi:polysaccharide pyruvyl transferase WcaK-like protein